MDATTAFADYLEAVAQLRLDVEATEHKNILLPQPAPAPAERPILLSTVSQWARQQILTDLFRPGADQ